MEINTEKKYDIVIVGGNLFSSQIAIQLAQTKLNILLISSKDFSDTEENYFINISRFSNKNEYDSFYSCFSHSIIPAAIYNLNKTNLVDGFSKELQSFIRKKVLSKKQFKQIETKINLDNKTSVTLEQAFKINYPRLCIDTLKTAKSIGVDIFTYAEIKEIKEKKIIFSSGNEINAELIINTDFNFLDENFKNQVLIKKSSFFTVPKFALNINNPLRIRTKNQINIIPYFSEIFINSNENEESKSIIEKIKLTTGFQINKDIIITEQIISNLSSNIIYDNNKNLNIFESDFSLFKEKINEVLSEISKILSINKFQYKEFKISTSFDIQADKHNFIRMLEARYLQVQETGITPNEYTVLFYRYGNDLEKIIEKAYDFYNDKETRKNAWLYAELWYSINYEFVKTTEDFIYRRTDFGLINQLDKEKREIISNFIGNAR